MLRATMLSIFVGQIPFVFVEPKSESESESKAPVANGNVLNLARAPQQNKISNQAKLSALNSFLSPASLAKLGMTSKRMRYFLDIKDGLEMDIKALRKEFRINSPAELTSDTMRAKYESEEANIIDEAMESTMKLLDANQRRMLRETELRLSDVNVLRSALKRYELTLESKMRKFKSPGCIEG